MKIPYIFEKKSIIFIQFFLFQITDGEMNLSLVGSIQNNARNDQRSSNIDDGVGWIASSSKWRIFDDSTWAVWQPPTSNIFDEDSAGKVRRSNADPNSRSASDGCWALFGPTSFSLLRPISFWNVLDENIRSSSSPPSMPIDSSSSMALSWCSIIGSRSLYSVLPSVAAFDFFDLAFACARLAHARLRSSRPRSRLIRFRSKIIIRHYFSEKYTLKKINSKNQQNQFSYHFNFSSYWFLAGTVPFKALDFPFTFSLYFQISQNLTLPSVTNAFPFCTIPAVIWSSSSKNWSMPNEWSSRVPNLKPNHIFWNRTQNSCKKYFSQVAKQRSTIRIGK